VAATHDASKRQEKNLAASVRGGKVTPRSGAGWMKKADVRSERFLYEAKTTGTKSYSLTAVNLEKLRKQAYESGRECGIMVIQLGGREYAVLPMPTWIEESGGG